MIRKNIEKVYVTVNKIVSLSTGGQRSRNEGGLKNEVNLP